VFFFALLVAGLQMIEPLFMRYIIDHVLLNQALDTVAKLSRLHLAGIAFLTVVVCSNLLGRGQGLPAEAAQHPGHAVAPPIAVSTGCSTFPPKLWT
jgi:ABC-type multidrug transport system fused ATPase/permease subunit